MPDLLYSMENVLSSASPNENITIETSEMGRHIILFLLFKQELHLNALNTL